MKTTLNIDASVMTRLKREAANRKCTMSELVETALRLLLDAKKQESKPLPPLPVYNGGGFLVNIDDRDELYRAMEGD